MHYVIVGGGLAAARAAETLRTSAFVPARSFTSLLRRPEAELSSSVMLPLSTLH